MKAVAVLMMLAAGLSAAACSNSSDQVTTTNKSCANLSGNFQATSFTATGTQNATLTNNFLSNGGAFTLAFSNGTTFNSSFTPQTGGTAMTETGTVTTSGNTITLGNQALWTNGISGAQTFACSIAGNTLTLSDTAATFMFAGDTIARPARFDITLVHQ